MVAAMAYLGCLSYDQRWLKSDDNGGWLPLVDTAGYQPSLVDADASGDTPNSRCGVRFTSAGGHFRAAGYIARSGSQVVYHVKFKNLSQAGDWLILYSHASSNTVNGTVRAYINGTDGYVYVEVLIAGTWTALGNSGAAVTAHMVLGILVDNDPVTAANRKVEIYFDGTKKGSTMSNTNITVAHDTLRTDANSIAGKSPTIDRVYDWEFSDTLLKSTDFQVYADYPRVDVENPGGWATTGGPAGNTDLWRRIDDVEDNDDYANDYLTVSPNGTNLDAWFKPTYDIFNGTSDVNGISVSAGRDYDVAGSPPDQIGIRKASDHATVVWKAVTFNYSDPAWGFAAFGTAPDGGAWTPTKYQDLEVGIRCNRAGGAVAANCALLVIDVVGNLLKRPAKASAPGGAGHRRRVLSVI